MARNKLLSAIAEAVTSLSTPDKDAGSFVRDTENGIQVTKYESPEAARRAARDSATAAHAQGDCVITSTDPNAPRSVPGSGSRPRLRGGS